jgi:hypothetical protein
MRDALNCPSQDRVSQPDGEDRDAGGEGAHGGETGFRRRDEDIGLQVDEFPGQRRHALGHAPREPKCKEDIAALYEPKVA